MIQRTSTTLALLLLAACQSSAGSVEADREWRQQIEQSQAELRRQVQVLGSSFASRDLDLAAMGHAGADLPGQPASADEMTAWFAVLGDQVERLSATVLKATAARPAEAAHTSTGGVASAPTGAASTAAIEPLSEALSVLERQRALHCENIANAGVAGYKRRSLRVITTLSAPDGVRLPRASGTAISMLPGALEFTGNQHDLAIEGAGFFEIQLPNGELRYTRNGAFRQDVRGRLVTAEGYLLTDQVAVPTGTHDLSISGDGQVFALEPDNTLAFIGTIRLHAFANATGLRLADDTLFIPTASSGQAQARQPGVQGAGAIKQGYLERSNVDMTRELVDLQLVDRHATAIRHALASHGIFTR